MVLANPDSGESKLQNVSLVNAFPNLTFVKPVFLTHSNDGTNRIFVVEQPGRIKVFPNDAEVTRAELFLDFQNRVNDRFTEMGLLGLAFHPDFGNNGFFYVNYTTGDFLERRTVISRFSMDINNPNLADPNSEFILLEILQPFTNHNGGMLQFGPEDGYLYIGLGDGGSGGDPENHGQNRATLLGAILRIDVDNPTGKLNYGIPPDNPFVGNTQGLKEEIWAYGLRNPWRFSIDPVTGELWVGDVGQNLWEEVDLIEKGKNYGWRIMEGFHCFNPSNCDPTGLALPIVEYGHNLGCSITGGYIYRGSLQPELEGAYIYGDYCSGRIWMLRHENNQLMADSLLIEPEFDLAISSFGVDEENELFIIDHNGKIYRFAGSPPTDVQDDDVVNIPDTFSLEQNYPNPFNPETLISYQLAVVSDVELTIYNFLGQKIRTLVYERQRTGTYKVYWDGRNDAGVQVSSGVYLYRLRVGRFVQTRKMILRK
ncbi:MAG: PQQ-dependent sugar dehydrogenase [bacterium]